MRKGLLTLLLLPVILLVCSNVSVARDGDRSPPGTESKTFDQGNLNCQVPVYQVAELPDLVPAQDICLSANLVDLITLKDVRSRPAPDQRPDKNLYRWGAPDHPLRE